MKFITFIRRFAEWRYLILVLLFIQQTATAQSVPVYATTISSQNNVDFSTNAVDNSLATRARIRAGSGIAVGIGAYSGHLELQFPSTLPAGTTSFVKIQTEDDLLPSLLGGSLGNLLSGVLGTVLVGNQEFTIEAKNGTTTELTGQSQVTNDFATPRLRIVVNASNEYFIAITPAQAYDRIRLTNRLGSLIGLNNTKRLDVYGAFYIGTPDICGGASYTSFDGSGLTLDLLGLGGAGVNNPHYAIDANPNNFSRLNLGILGVAASVEQMVYFDGLSQPTDQFFVRMRIDPALLTLGVANNVQIVASNGPSTIQAINLNALLNVDLLTLLQENQPVSIPFSPGTPVNRITVRYNSLLNVQLTQSLDLYGVTRAPANPVITDLFTQNPVICSGSTASLVAQTGAGTELNWYSAASGGSPLATTNSGQPFITPVLTENTSYFVAAKRTGCPEESPRIRIDVEVIDLPAAADISISSPLSACNGSVILSPSSSIGGAEIRYYKDQAKTQEITTGFSGDPGVAYIKDDTAGTLSISGLTAINSPYTYYISLTVNGLCENEANTLKPVVVNFSSALDLVVLPAISDCGAVNLKDAILNFDSSSDIQYNFFDAASQPITAEAAATIQTGGTYYIQEVSLSGSCSSALGQVSVTVNPNPTLVIPDANLVANVGSSVTLDATSESQVTWYDAQGNALSSNIYGPFTTPGFYTFTAIANNGNCSVTGSVSVVVIDPTDCPALTERVYADSQSWGSILTGGVSSANSAVDENPQTYSTIITGIGLLGIGTTWQTLQWDDTIAAGTPVTIKLGSQYSGLVALGAYSVVGTKRNSTGIPVDIGPIQPVSGSLADLLPGENSFEYTFVPSDATGPKPYDGVRIIVGSVASVAQNVKVYEAYYDQQVAQVACTPGDVEDVFSGAVDLGAGIATTTVGVNDPWDAVDGDNNTFATMYTGAGILAAADLTVSFKTPTLTTDSLQIIVSRPATILDLSLLSGFTIQLYMGNTPVSAPIAASSSLVNLALIDANTRMRITLSSQTVVYDRIKIRFGGAVNVLDQLRIHEIKRTADTSVIDADSNNAIDICAGQTISLSVAADDCMTYIWYDAETGGNVISTGSNFAIPSAQPAGTYTYYIQPVRFGCETFERGSVTVTVGQTAPPTAITDISLNGGTGTTFCDQIPITLTATLDSTITITNPVFHWYDNAGAAITGETSPSLVLTGLVPGTYTYSVGISSDEYCETAEPDRAHATFTILTFSLATDIDVDDTLICQGGTAVLTPTSVLPNPLFVWYFANDDSQPVISGSTVAGITYTIDASGQISVSGLTIANNPLVLYVGMTSDATCLNQNGNFKAVTIIINDSGTPTTNDNTQDFCQSQNPTLADIQVNETNVIWFDAATAGNQLPDTTTLASGTTYYAGFAPSTGCGSAVRLAVTVNVNDAPTPTANNTTQDFCLIDNPTVANIQTNEPGVTWFSTSIGGTPLNPADALVNGTIYYGSLTTNGCESSVRLEIAVNVNDADTPTTNSKTQSFCLVDNPIVADLQVNEPGVTWYDAASGGNALAVTDLLTNGTTYYASMTDTDSGCESSVRLEVSVIVNDPSTPTTGNSTQTFCTIDNPTIADIQVNETNIVWYDAVSGGNVLASTDGLTDNATYYVALFDPATGCESSVRLAVTVNISDAPTPTTTDATQEFCLSVNPTVGDIQVNETNTIWYNAAIGGTVVAASDALIDGMTYYAAQIVNGCESSIRLAVTVTIINGGTPSTGDDTQDFCLADNPTIADIQANESNIVWYDAATGGNVLAATTVLANGLTYYAGFDDSVNCVSPIRLAVTVTVNDPGTPSTNDGTQEFCQSANPTVADLQINEINVVWYASQTGGTALASTDQLAVGTYYAALADADTGCESSTRLAVIVGFIGDNAATITGGNLQPCVFETSTYTTEAGMSNYVWTVTNGTITAGGQSGDNYVTVTWPTIVNAAGVSVSYTNSCSGTSTGFVGINIVSCSDITIAKTVDNPTPSVQDNVTFTITVHNNGTGNFYDVVVSELLPGGYVFVGAAASDGTTYDNVSGIWNIPMLLAGKTVTLEITATVMGTGNYLNIATITGSNPIDTDVLNNHAEAAVEPICLVVYNEFSPNNDGANDIFHIDCIENFPDNKLDVYNRYGSLVYSKRHYANDWDGTANVSGVINKDDKLPAGTYYYVLDIGAEGVKTGWLAITR